MPLIFDNILQMAAGSNTVFSISIRDILEYYAILCIVLMPVSFYVLIYLNKRTSLIEKINRKLDRIFGLEEQKKTEKTEKKTTENNAEKPQDNDDSDGITRFNIFVGDKYFCRVNSMESTRRTKALSWISQNEFVAKINKKTGEFEAKKSGRILVYYQDENNSFDTGTQVYDITVVQRNPNWFADKFITFMNKNAVRDEVCASLIGRKITSENPSKKTVTYEGNSPEKRLVLQFDSKDRLQRVLWEYNSSINETNEEFSKELEDRFEKVAGKGGVSIWIREFIDDKRDEVEMYAFHKRTSSGTYVFAIGKTWREYGDVEEFLMNIGMCEKMFSDILKDEPTTEFAVDKEYAKKKSAGPKSEPEPEPEEIPTPAPELPEHPAEPEPTVDEKEETASEPEPEEPAEEPSGTDGPEDEETGGESTPAGENAPEELSEDDIQDTDAPADGDIDPYEGEEDPVDIDMDEKKNAFNDMFKDMDENE